MASERLSLPEALERVRAHAQRAEWASAESLCRALFAQLPDGALNAVAEQWVSVRRAQGRDDEAAGVLHGWLRRARWMRSSAASPAVILYGLDTLARGQVLFRSPPKARLAFSINGGHFDATQLLRHADFAVDRVFLDGAMSAQAIRECSSRLSGYAVIINSIADPASEEPALRVAAGLCAPAPRVINPPLAVLASSRQAVAARLAGIAGLVVPRIDRLDPGDRALLGRRLETHPAGLILRPENSQTGVGVALARNEAEIDAWLRTHGDSRLYATDYHDFRGRNGLYRKFRVFVVGARLLPEHLISAPQWNIHSADRRLAMLGDPALREAERDFLADPQRVLGVRAWRALEQIAGLMGLDYLGIDFSVLETGEVLLFEANPGMRLNFDHCERFPYLKPHLEAVSQAFCQHIRSRLP